MKRKKSPVSDGAILYRVRILITGASGFIGGRILERLSSDEHRLVCTGRSRPPKGMPPSVEFHVGDLADPSFTDRAAVGVDLIIHCAGKAGPWGPLAEYRLANVVATRNLLESARSNGVKRFINLSSPSIYFEFRNQLGLKEGYLPKRFSNAYARTKYEAERLVSQAHCASLETISLRPRLVIGAGDTNILPRLIAFQESGALRQVGDGKNEVSVTSVTNLVDAIVLCMNAPSAAMGDVYNLSNGESIRFWELVNEVLEKLGIPTDRKKVPYRLAVSLARINEIWARLRRVRQEPTFLPVPVAILGQSMTLNIDKARQRLGYQPRQTTSEAVNEFVSWWKQKERSKLD